MTTTQPALPPCSTCWRAVDPAVPHVVLVEQTEQHHREADDVEAQIVVSHARVLTARHAECP